VGFPGGDVYSICSSECNTPWLQHLEGGHEICAVFFDSSKAFGTLPYLSLISKLQKIGLDPLITTWIQNYLPKRYQKVVLLLELVSVKLALLYFHQRFSAL